MKVKIVSCNRDGLWYKNRIGQIFKVVCCNSNDFWKIVEDETDFFKEGFVYYILKDDCRIISDQEQEEIIMKVKIKSCDNDGCWYKKHVGEFFNVTEDRFEDNSDYWAVIDDINCISDIKQYFIRKDECEIVSDEVKIPERPIEFYPIEDLMKWRNVASARVDKIDSDLVYLANIIKETFQKIWKLKKKRKHDVKWIVKLNKILDYKVFKDRSKYVD